MLKQSLFFRDRIDLVFESHSKYMFAHKLGI